MRAAIIFRRQIHRHPFGYINTPSVICWQPSPPDTSTLAHFDQCINPPRLFISIKTSSFDAKYNRVRKAGHLFGNLNTLPLFILGYRPRISRPPLNIEKRSTFQLIIHHLWTVVSTSWNGVDWHLHQSHPDFNPLVLNRASWSISSSSATSLYP